MAKLKVEIEAGACDFIDFSTIPNLNDRPASLSEWGSAFCK